MIGKFLLDTNIIIRLFAKDKAVLDWIKKAPETFVPSIVLGSIRRTLLWGSKTANAEANKAKIFEFSYKLKCFLVMLKQPGTMGK